MRSVLVMALLGTLGLASCGGGGGGAGPSGLSAPANAHFRVSAQAIKALHFQWDPVPGATHYRVFEDVDGDSGPQAEQAIGPAAAGPAGFTWQDVFLSARVNARYQLQACDGQGCVDMARAGIEGIDGGIGYAKASNPAAGDRFGEGLALSADGQLLAVGAPLEDGLNAGIDTPPNRGATSANVGAVYVFHRAAAGWEQEAYIKPETPLLGGQFGPSLTLARHAMGYTLLVGATGDASGGSGVGANPGATPALGDSGAAYVFERDANGHWTQTRYIKAQSPEAGAGYGSSVSLSADGQWAAVGQPYGANGGSVSLYRREVGGWAFVQALQGGNTENGDAFGENLQLDPEGNTLVVGASLEDGSTDTEAPDDDAAADAGAVYVFGRGANGLWQQTAYLKAPERRVNGYFGFPVALSSGADTLVVGEPGNSNGGATPMAERVHVFRKEGGNWVHETGITASLPQTKGGFGGKLALSADGSTLAIANAWEDSRGSGLTQTPTLDAWYANAGSVYLYRRTGAGAWAAPVPIKAPNNMGGFQFGWSLALSANGGTLAVHGRDSSGASGIGGNPNDASAPEAGAVYLY